MSVKSIFKILLGTIVIMISTSLFMELFNVSISGMQVKQMTRMAAKQACVLFTQETYKTDGKNGASKVTDIYADDGTFYLTGNFYGTTDAQTIWNNIYTNREFLDFCVTPEMQQYKSVQLLRKAALSDGYVDIPEVTWDSSSAELVANVDATTAQMYYDNMYTTVNLGIPYMDKTVTNKMFQWNLAQLLSNCDNDLIQVDDSGKHFINYKGFRCYADEAKITNYDYKVYDLSTSSGKTEFYNDTGMKASSLGISKGGSYLYEKDAAGNIIKDNVLVTVVGIEYSIPMAYEGITPIRKIFKFAWNNEVKGFTGDGGGEVAANRQDWGDDSFRSGVGSGGLEALTGGGITGYTYNGVDTGTNGVVPTSGRLVYVLVR